MTLTPIAERLAVELSLPVLRLGSVAAGIEQDEYLSHHTCCRACGSGAITTCFYDSGLSQPVIEPRSLACEANAVPLRQRGGYGK